MVSLGQRIRELRMRKGLSQIDLAKGLCTPSMISQIESDRARPSYKILFAIADRLEVKLDNLLSDVDMNLEFLSSYKMARAMVSDKQYTVAIPLLREVLGAPHSIIPTAEIQFVLAKCYFHTGQIQESEAILLEIKKTAEFRQDYSMLSLSYMYLGLTMGKRRKYQIAIFHLQKALEEARKAEIEDVFLTSEILTHLGKNVHKLGMLQEAIHYFEQAMELRKDGGSLEDTGKMLLQLSQLHGRLKKVDKAIDYAERARGFLDGIEHLTLHLRVKMASATLLGQTGHEEEAVTLLGSVIDVFRSLGNFEEVGMALIELAKVQVKLGHLEDAESSCLKARETFPELHKGQIGVHRTLGQIALQRRDRVEANQRLRRAAGLAKTLGEESEWQSSLYQIATLYAEDRQMEDAYLLMEEIHQHTQHVLEERGIVL